MNGPALSLREPDPLNRDFMIRPAPGLKIGFCAAFVAVYAFFFAVRTCVAQSERVIDLEADLIIGEATGESFGGGLRLAVNSEGWIYVGDWMNRHIRVFDRDGESRETIGRSGHGPGEFSAIHQVAVGRGDSLYVWDANARRLSVFAPERGHPLAYTLTLADVDGLGRPGRFFVPSDPAAGFLFVFIQQAEGTLSVHRVDREGRVSARPLLEGRHSDSAVRVAGQGTQVVRTSPLFGREALIGLTPQDELYYGWSETIDLTFYDLSGRRIGEYRAEAPAISVTARDIKYELEGASEMRRRAIRRSEHPKTKPALHTVIVDDEARIWLGRYTTDPTKSEWWVGPNTGNVAPSVFTLPARVELKVVRGGYAYAVSTDDVGYPTIVRYILTVKGTAIQ